jgi:hypothetical protein
LPGRRGGVAATHRDDDVGPAHGIRAALARSSRVVNPGERIGCRAYVDIMSERDQQNTQGVPGEGDDADTASGGAPEEPDTSQHDADDGEDGGAR